MESASFNRTKGVGVLSLFISKIKKKYVTRGRQSDGTRNSLWVQRIKRRKVIWILCAVFKATK